MTLHKFAIARHLLLAALLIVGTLAAVLLWATLLTAAAGIPPASPIELLSVLTRYTLIGVLS